LIGSYQNVVEMKLGRREHAWVVFPYDRLAVSLEEPDAFLDAIQ
jgi:hypothetical protein